MVYLRSTRAITWHMARIDLNEFFSCILCGTASYVHDKALLDNLAACEQIATIFDSQLRLLSSVLSCRRSMSKRIILV